MNQRTYLEDTKLIDLIGVVIAGVGIPLYIYLVVYSRLDRIAPDFIVFVFTHLGSFILAWWLLSLWRGKMRAKVGWIAIALIGSILSAVIKDSLPRVGSIDPVFTGTHNFIFESVFLSYVSLLLMVMVHIIGFIIWRLRRKWAA